MKIRIIYLLFILAFTSCSEWLDVNDDPNKTDEASIDLVIPSAQASLAARLGGNLFNAGGFFAQYWSQAPEANQYNEEDEYDMTTDYLDDDYNELFAGALSDLEYVREVTLEEEDYGNHLVAVTLRAYIFQMWVDMVDRVPYSEALQGFDNLNPTWEDGETVYQGLIAELDEALNLIDNVSVVVESDMILGGDLQQWIGFANALKLKIYMRQSNVNDVQSQVNQLISEGNFMTTNVAFSGFSDQENKRNPWYGTEYDLGANNHVGTVTIIDFLKNNNDPRLGEMFEIAETPGEFTGIYPALKQVQSGLLTSDFSLPIIGATQPVYLFTMAELYFFIAEAELMFNSDPAAAKAAYESGIDANLAMHGFDPDTITLYTAPSRPYYFDETEDEQVLFEQIMTQKWISLCMVNHLEAWTELRRTNIPSYYGNYDDYTAGTPPYPGGLILDPASNLLSNGIYYPQRLPYPDIAVSRNTTLDGLDGLASFENKIWWDNN